MLACCIVHAALTDRPTHRLTGAPFLPSCLARTQTHAPKTCASSTCAAVAPSPTSWCWARRAASGWRGCWRGRCCTHSRRGQGRSRLECRRRSRGHWYARVGCVGGVWVWVGEWVGVGGGGGGGWGVVGGGGGGGGGAGRCSERRALLSARPPLVFPLPCPAWVRASLTPAQHFRVPFNLFSCLAGRLRVAGCGCRQRGDPHFPRGRPAAATTRQKPGRAGEAGSTPSSWLCSQPPLVSLHARRLHAVPLLSTTSFRRSPQYATHTLGCPPPPPTPPPGLPPGVCFGGAVGRRERRAHHAH